MTQDSLHGFGFDFRLVHQPVAKRVTQVVETELLPVLDMHSGFPGCRSQIVGDEYRRAERFPSPGSHRWKHKVGFIGMWRLALPRTKRSEERRVGKECRSRWWA